MSRTSDERSAGRANSLARKAALLRSRIPSPALAFSLFFPPLLPDNPTRSGVSFYPSPPDSRRLRYPICLLHCREEPAGDRLSRSRVTAEEIEMGTE